MSKKTLLFGILCVIPFVLLSVEPAQTQQQPAQLQPDQDSKEFFRNLIQAAEELKRIELQSEEEKRKHKESQKTEDQRIKEEIAKLRNEKALFDAKSLQEEMVPERHDDMADTYITQWREQKRVLSEQMTIMAPDFTYFKLGNTEYAVMDKGKFKTVAGYLLNYNQRLDGINLAIRNLEKAKTTANVKDKKEIVNKYKPADTTMMTQSAGAVQAFPNEGAGVFFKQGDVVGDLTVLSISHDKIVFGIKN